MMFLHIDLCCGLGGWGEPFRESSEWRSVGLDIRTDLEADVIGDVRQLPFNASPTLLTMSPPCTEFSYWDMPFSPDGMKPSLELIEACLEAVEQLNPRYWILENVRGLHLYWKTADKVSDPWYFWGDFPPFDFERMSKNMGCLDRRREAYDPTRVKGLDAAKLPYHISYSLMKSVEWTVAGE